MAAFTQEGKLRYNYVMRDERGGEINTDLSKLLRLHESQWVALSPTYDTVVASGDTLGETIAKVDAAERSHVVLYRVLPANSFYAPFA